MFELYILRLKIAWKMLNDSIEKLPARGDDFIKGTKSLCKEFIDKTTYFNNRFIRKWPKKKISPEQRHLMREIYFKRKGYDFDIPKDSKGRRELASKLTVKTGKPDFEAAIMLFDPDLDKDNSDWYFRLGWLYDQLTDNAEHFDPLRATIFNTESADMGDHTAQFNLGIDSEQGYESSVNVGEAEYWYTRAFIEREKQRDFGGWEHAEILGLVRLRAQYPEYYKNIYQDKQAVPLIDRHILNNWSDLEEQKSKIVARYKSLRKNPDQLLEFMTNIILRHNRSAPITKLIIWRRMKLGIGLGLNNLGNQSYLSQQNHDSYLANGDRDLFIDSLQHGTYNSAIYRNMVRDILSLDKETEIPSADIKLSLALAEEQMLSPSDTIDINIKISYIQQVSVLRRLARNLEENEECYNDVRTLVRSIKDKEISFEDACQRINEGVLNTSPAVVDYLGAAYEVMSLDDPVNSHEWRDLLTSAEAVSMDQTLEILRKSTLTEGPVYNASDDESGLPILGHLLHASKSDTAADKSFSDTGRFVPTEGIVDFRGIKAFEKGTFKLDVISTEKGSGVPAFVLPQDIEVALALVFGEKLDLNQICLSLERPESDRVKKEYGNDLPKGQGTTRHKVWSPKWLGHTHLGRTLYTTDELIGRVCWDVEEFNIVDKNRGLTQESSETLRQLVFDIKTSGGRSIEATASRVMIRPANHVVIEQQEVNHILREKYKEIRVRDFGMFVEGDYSLGDQRMIARDDPTYAHGRRTTKLTERYHDISVAMPVFERGRQLTKMLYAFDKLRQSGWQPNAILQKQIEEATQKYRNLPQQGLDELLMQTRPFKRKGPAI